MYRWCAYCQRYLGEKAPLDDYSPTHGICEGCAAHGLSDPDAFERVKPIVAFHADLLRMARTGEHVPVASVVQRGLALGIRHADLLIGMLQPALYEVGRLWEQCQLTPEREAAFSSFCDAVVSELTLRQELLSPPGGPLVLLLNAELNFHTIGLRMATFLLREAGLNAQAITPTPPREQLAGLLSRLRPSIVGVSVATSWQLPYLDTLVGITAALDPVPRVVAGGAAIRAGCGLPAGVEGWARLEELPQR